MKQIITALMVTLVLLMTTACSNLDDNLDDTGSATLTGTKSSNTSYFADSMSTTDDYEFVKVFSNYSDGWVTQSGTIDIYVYEDDGNSHFIGTVSPGGSSYTV
jgi:hypothetical protein